MTETVLIYATQRQRKQLTRQGIEILTEYEDYVSGPGNRRAGRATASQSGYEVEIYRHGSLQQGVGIRGWPSPAERPRAGRLRPRPALLPGRTSSGRSSPSGWLRSRQHGGRVQDPSRPHGYVVALDDPAYDVS